jgi:sugar/nucleoside kinase (ribokinase family)
MAAPVATIGLGDTFLAGTLLVLSANGPGLSTGLAHKNAVSTPQNK